MTLDGSWKDKNGRTVYCRDLLEYRYIDRIRVVGKSESVAVYEIIAEKDQLTQREKDLCLKWKEAMSLYLDMKWKEAEAAFKKTEKIERFPEGITTPSKVMIARCKVMHKKSAELNIDREGKWDGIYELAFK